MNDNHEAGISKAEAIQCIRKAYADTGIGLYDKFLDNGCEFIQIGIEKVDEHNHAVAYVVCSSMEEIRRIMEQEGNQGYSEWHSDDVELVGYNNLLERQLEIERSREIKKQYDMLPFANILGECTVRIEKDKITFI